MNGKIFGAGAWYSPQEEENMNNRRLIIVFTVVTAVIHLVLGFGFLPDALAIAFVLNGLGYLALLAGIYFIPQMAAQAAMLKKVLLGFTAVTIVLYFVMNGGAAFSNIMGLVDKVVEIALVAVLWRDK